MPSTRYASLNTHTLFHTRHKEKENIYWLQEMAYPTEVPEKMCKNYCYLENNLGGKVRISFANCV